MFSISESYAQKRYTFISQRLMKALDLPNDKSLTGENLEVIIDVTEQEIERPLKEQKSFYPGKKAPSNKNLIDCLLFDRTDSRGEKFKRDNSRFSNPEKEQSFHQSKCPDQD